METLREEELPHRGTMRWVRKVREVDGGTESLVDIGIEHPFLESAPPGAAGARRLMRSALIEVMAQGAAAGTALRCRKAGRRIRAGYLVGIRELEILGDAGVGVLRVVARPERSAGAMTLVSLEVFDETKQVARGRLTFHLSFE